MFSEVASFAITCAVNGCDVRFVSLTKPGGDGSTASAGPSLARGVAYPEPPAPAPAWGAAAAPPGEPTSSDN